MTNDLTRRVGEHGQRVIQGHTARYRTTRLVYFGAAESAYSAIAREKQIKGPRREKKIALIAQANRTWEDLAADWFADRRAAQQVPRCVRDNGLEGTERPHPPRVQSPVPQHRAEPP